MQNKAAKHKIDQSALYKLRSRSKLSKLLGISNADLRRLTRSTDALYSEFDVPKKNGGSREVENPKRKLKLVQARIARILSQINPPDYLFCPVKGRCYISNAAQHRSHRIVRCLDIRRYFPSTPSRRVFWFFNKIMLCEPDIAATLARLATYQDYLPTGSPLSPIMAYFAYYDVWQNIGEICKNNGYTLTVYIDDVTISGDYLLPEIIWSIKREIHRSGLQYHKEKTYIDRPAEITGVIVNGDQLLPPNRQLKKVKDTLAALRGPISKKSEKDLNDKLNGLRGQISQIAAN